MLLDLLDAEPEVRIRHQYLCDQVLSLLRKELWQSKVSLEDFLI